MKIEFMHIVGFLIIIIIYILFSIFLSRKTKNNLGKNGGNSSIVVSGLLIGTLAGGSSTVGTAQLAYNYGLSAWWYTLGAGIGCLILAFFYCIPFRKKCDGTITKLLYDEYGHNIGIIASVLSSIGTYINIIAQLIAASSLIFIIFPKMDLICTLLISASLMAFYILFGGTKGVGIFGIFKTVLLYISVIGCGVLVIKKFGGVDPIFSNTILLDGNYFYIFSRGLGKDLGSGISLVIGVLSTQAYAQACMSAKSDSDAKKGALISAFMIPPIGIGGILIGMYMRVYYPNLEAAKYAFSSFVVDNINPLLGGAIIATLLIAVIGTGAGLTLGVSTVINRDLFPIIYKRKITSKESIIVMNMTIIFILISAVLVSLSNIGDLILDYSFMSMGLRGAVLFVPISALLFLKEKINKVCMYLSIIISPLSILLLQKYLSFDPLFVGILVSFAFISIGHLLTVNYMKNQRRVE